MKHIPSVYHFEMLDGITEMNAVPSNGTRDEETLVFGRIVNRKKQYLIFFCSSVFKNYSDDTVL